MTEVVDLFKKKKGSQKNLKPIELVNRIFDDNNDPIIDKAVINPKNYGFVALLNKGGDEFFDLIACWNKDNEADEKTLYLGNWNDGVVE